MTDTSTGRMHPVVWADGRAWHADDFSVSPAERAFRYGDGVFATIAVEADRLLDAPAHLSRLAAGARRLGLGVPQAVGSPVALADALRAIGVRSRAVVRVQISAGPGGRGYAREETRSWELIQVSFPPTRRPPRVAILPDGQLPTPALPGVKCCSAVAHVLCARAARELGIEEAVRVHRGHVAEASSANLFWLSRGRLHTPAEDLPLYPGVTREVVLRVAREMGLDVEVGRFPPEVASAGEAAFLTSAVRGIEPIAELDGRPLEVPDLLQELQGAVKEARLAGGIPLPRS